MPSAPFGSAATLGAFAFGTTAQSSASALGAAASAQGPAAFGASQSNAFGKGMTGNLFADSMSTSNATASHQAFAKVTLLRHESASRFVPHVEATATGLPSLHTLHRSCWQITFVEALALVIVRPSACACPLAMLKKHAHARYGSLRPANKSERMCHPMAMPISPVMSTCNEEEACPCFGQPTSLSACVTQWQCL